MIKHARNIIKFCVVLLVICIFLLLSAVAEAAVLYLEPAEGDYYQGDTFMVEARIDTEGECINTVKADLSFSQDILEAVDFSRGDSILSLWVYSPRIDQDSGLISWAGGIPAGYCGRVPGDPGTSNLLGKIILKIQATSDKRQAEINFRDSSQVLLNDGKGTPAQLTSRGAVFTILAKPFDYVQGQDEWQKELENDKIPPEPFVIEVRQEPTIFEGKYFLIFSTTDKQTGLDHYEILETSDKKPGNWKVGDSPYLLEDQSLESAIKVRAVDKAGNEMVVEIEPLFYAPPEKKPFPYWIIVLIAAGGGIVWWIVRKLKKRTFHKIT